MYITKNNYAQFLIESNYDPVIALDPKGIILNVNEAALKLFHTKREEIIGANFSSHFAEPENAKKAYETLVKLNSIFEYPLKIKIKNNESVEMHFNGNAHKTDEGIVAGYLVIARKPTEKKFDSQYVRSLIEASRDPLFTVNAKGEITDINNASIEVTGVSRDKLIGSAFTSYFTDPKKARKGYQEVFTKGFVVDYPLTITDGHLTDVLFNGSVYKNEMGKVVGALVIARDITEQKRVEKELIEAKIFAELATELADDAKLKAEASAEAAEDALKAKQQFLTNMSHEIRTPMNAIIGFTKVLIKTELSAKQREYLNAIKMSGDALIVLINDILDLAKVEAGKMTFEQNPFKMASSISSMLHLFEPKIQEKNLQLITSYDTTIPEVLVGDSIRLHQIILNLLSNAVKFTNKGKIEVRVKLLKENENEVTIEFTISDTGIGIAENNLDKIFENFQQATSSTSRLYGGTGLGLAIVKQLVTSQNGTINVSSELGEGSKFCFTLNYLKTKSAIDPQFESFELDPDVKNIRVLVVEDIPLNQLLVKTLLDDFGFERDVAENGKIAIEKLSKKTYDIILMDLQMPEMNGFEATEYIRNTMHSRIPIIALTADVTTVDLEKCKAIGMNDYIVKPVDDRLLYNKIVSLVKKKTTQNEAEKVIPLQHKVTASKFVDLAYLDKRTKSNPTLMMEMISLYLEQTPPLISAIRQSLINEDWNTLQSAVHKILPSFVIMGINGEFETKAKKIQEYAASRKQMESIQEMVTEIEYVCLEACKELEIELDRIKLTAK